VRRDARRRARERRDDHRISQPALGWQRARSRRAHRPEALGGDVVRIDIHWAAAGMPMDWWRSDRGMSGGILYDWACTCWSTRCNCCRARRWSRSAASRPAGTG
jgi:hypothetical protein